MGDFVLYALAAIGAFVVALAAALTILLLLGSAKVRVTRDRPLPNSDLPALDPATFKALHDDIAAFEDGEKP
ncbi:hypothetical protein [Nonomuraea sp. NPDC050643]|uniref:hypothetical protein n=1 Tax=Nonomuraea sp. NPDC050643 TaxID=3155660 RepID=UPI0033F14020